MFHRRSALGGLEAQRLSFLDGNAELNVLSQRQSALSLKESYYLSCSFSVLWRYVPSPLTSPLPLPP